MSGRILKAESGVTLLEIMMSLLIMTSVMIPVASLMGYGGRATSKDARRIAALQILEKTLRQLLNEPFDQITIGAAIKKSFNKVELGTIIGPSGFSYEVQLASRFVSPVNFSYQNVKVNLPAFDPEKPKSTDFANPESLSLTNCVIE